MKWVQKETETGTFQSGNNVTNIKNNETKNGTNSNSYVFMFVQED